jgi:hypothetical protein
MFVNKQLLHLAPRTSTMDKEVISFGLALAAFFQEPSVATASGAIAAITTTALSRFETQNLQAFRQSVEDRLTRLERDDVNQEYVASDAFKELVITLTDAARRTAGATKRELLANGLISASVSTTVADTNLVFARLLDQLSELEIRALTLILQNRYKVNERVQHEGLLTSMHGYSMTSARICVRSLVALQLLGLTPTYGDASDDLLSPLHVYPTYLAESLIRWSQDATLDT